MKCKDCDFEIGPELLMKSHWNMAHSKIKNPALEAFIEQDDKNRITVSARSESCLSNWYPLIEGLVPTPKTEIIKTDVNFMDLFDQKIPAGIDQFFDEYREAIKRIGSMPVFIRSGHTSNKHDWENTCYLERIEDLEKHVEMIVCFSAMCDFYGLDLNTWVVREMLPTRPIFRAFSGHMPITKERRYFVWNGEVCCKHPYWPEDAVAEGNPDNRYWKGYLMGMNMETESEIKRLSGMSRKVSNAVPGYWSVDWLHTKNGWYLIDMARGEASYHWPDCPNNLAE